MIFNYLKIIFRNLLKNKVFSLINIGSLTIGIISCLLISLFIYYEFSFDGFHEKGDNICQINMKEVEEGREVIYGLSSGLTGPTLIQNLPSVVDYVRMCNFFNPAVFNASDENVITHQMIIVDSSFFKIFSFPLLNGDPSKVLSQPASVVLSESFAKKLFKGKNAVGEQVKGWEDQMYTVTGVAADPPENSTIKFEVLVSWETIVPENGVVPMAHFNGWGGNVFTFVETDPKANTQSLAEDVNRVLIQESKHEEDGISYVMQKYTDIYLHSTNVQFRFSRQAGNYQYVLILSIVGLFVLLISCINYINLQTAKSTKRAGEIGLRKVLGANRNQLIIQFIGETLAFTLIAVFISVLLADIALPYLNNITQKSIELNWQIARLFLPYLLLIIIVVSVGAGFFPAMVLSSYQPVQTLKNKINKTGSGSFVRKVLTIIQLAISVVIIGSTFFVYQQMQFMLNKELGFDKNQVLVMPLTDILIDKHESFRNELVKLPEVKQASIALDGLGDGGTSSVIDITVPGFNDPITGRFFGIDDYFLETYGMELLYGRNLSSTLASDKEGVIINEKLAHMLVPDGNIEKLLGESIKLWDGSNTAVITGIVKDFHFQSLHFEKEAIVMQLVSKYLSLASIKISSDNIPVAISGIEQVYKKFEKVIPFEYGFVDDKFEAFYRGEKTLLRLVITFSVLSIIIACLGLYGLTLFSVEQKTKEIGIRKVLGADKKDLALLINKQFFSLAILALAIAFPVTWLLSSSWLNNFVYKIEMSVWPYLLSALITLFVLFATIMRETLKALAANPVETLRSN
ncbi:MAG: hypothetical protein CMO01_24990 [Thalassobius sp.]|nr:hypothetical protein [Thalassovita sp.]